MKIDHDEIEAIVRQVLRAELGHGPMGEVTLQGGQSYKGIGEIVGQSLLRCPVVVVNGLKIRSVASHKPWWK